MKPSIYLLVEEAARLLLSKDLSISVAESCTGGMLAAAITSIPGASRFFKGGIIAYSNEAKEHLLHVPVETIEEFGAVSEETVDSLAESGRKTFGTTTAVSISGVAGPDGGTAAKPGGLVFIGAIVGDKKRIFKHNFEGNRQQVREAATECALRHLLEMLQDKKAGSRKAKN